MDNSAIRLDSVKTKSQFYQFADIWYQRSHRLRIIWQDENNAEEQKLKALKLWLIMYDRVMKLGKIANQFNYTKNHKEQ